MQLSEIEYAAHLRTQQKSWGGGNVERDPDLVIDLLFQLYHIIIEDGYGSSGQRCVLVTMA